MSSLSNPSQPSSSPSLANPLVTSSPKSSPQVSTTQSSSNFSSEKLLPQFKPTSSKKTTKKKYQQWKSNPVPSNPSTKKLPPTSEVTTKGENLRGREDYVCVEKDDSLPMHLILEDIREYIENDIVPEVL
ncbi:hypothetical protein TIFTF001_050302, partial [Ficus carica]